MNRLEKIFNVIKITKKYNRFHQENHADLPDF
jgi:hypothetical protein